MNLWKSVAGILVISAVLALVLDSASPQQRQMIMCSITPNCVYVMGVQQK